MTKYEVRQMKRQTKEIVADLFAHGEEPEFHALYRSSYGLQDRFNAIIYKCFKFQNASNPFQMLAYQVLMTYTINARGLWAEFQSHGR